MTFIEDIKKVSDIADPVRRQALFNRMYRGLASQGFRRWNRYEIVKVYDDDSWENHMDFTGTRAKARAEKEFQAHYRGFGSCWRLIRVTELHVSATESVITRTEVDRGYD